MYACHSIFLCFNYSSLLYSIGRLRTVATTYCYAVLTHIEMYSLDVDLGPSGV